MELRRRILVLKWIAVLVPAALVATYAINPFATPSLDPRQRIAGVSIYRMPASGMLPALVPGDLIATRVGRAQADAAQRGDIVTFVGHEDPRQVWIQRVVGLGGETLAIVDGRVLVDGRPLEEAYVEPGNVRTPYSLQMAPVRIPDGHVWLLGDNRDHSDDGRMRGAIPRSRIRGRFAAYLVRAAPPQTDSYAP